MRVLGLVRIEGKPDPCAPGARIEEQPEQGLWRIEGMWPEETASEALRHLIEQGATILEWRRGPATLEEVFRKLTLGEEES
jgi:hypothetical protein